MNLLGKIESAMQGVVEGSFGRVFRSRMQPVELAKKLERAMDQNLTIALGQRIAPNMYNVALSPRDYEQFERYPPSVLQTLQEGLIQVARTRGYKLTTRPQVFFQEDPRQITGQARIQAQLVEPRPGDPSPDDGMDATREMSPVEAQELAQQVAQARAAVASGPIPTAWLTLRKPGGGGQVYRIEQPVIHIGRHGDNDIVVNDRRVSRYHAEIRFERGEFVMYDLGSLNGIGINGRMTRGPVVLQNGDTVGVGNHDFIFQRK
ncbi:MAG TPA: DUF3662 and FHA domain-containing protein [Ktedonobacterales bacterium]|jgi:hypothetical protein